MKPEREAETRRLLSVPELCDHCQSMPATHYGIRLIDGMDGECSVCESCAIDYDYRDVEPLMEHQTPERAAIADLLSALDASRAELTAKDAEIAELRARLDGRKPKVKRPPAPTSHPRCPSRNGRAECKCAELFASDEAAKAAAKGEG